MSSIDRSQFLSLFALVTTTLCECLAFCLVAAGFVNDTWIVLLTYKQTNRHTQKPSHMGEGSSPEDTTAPWTSDVIFVLLCTVGKPDVDCCWLPSSGVGVIAVNLYIVHCEWRHWAFIWYFLVNYWMDNHYSVLFYYTSDGNVLDPEMFRHFSKYFMTTRFTWWSHSGWHSVPQYSL